MADPEFAGLVERAAARYAPAGRFAAGFARGKMRSDPVYRALLELGVGEAASVTDLGCGCGYLFALLLGARAGRPPQDLVGAELSARAVRLARLACGAGVSIVEADLAVWDVPGSDAITLVDVLHYLPRAVQDPLLERACAALPPDGRLFVRDADAGGGAGFLAVRLAERLMAVGRGEGFRRFDFRRGDELARRLEACGTAVAWRPMGAGTPFANILLEARRLA